MVQKVDYFLYYGCDGAVAGGEGKRFCKCLMKKYLVVLVAGIDMTFYFNNCLVKYLHATFILFWVWKLLLCLHHYNSIFSDHSPLGDHSKVSQET